MTNNKFWGVLAENFGAEIEFIHLFHTKEEAETFKHNLDEYAFYYHTALLNPKETSFYLKDSDLYCIITKDVA